MRLVSRRGEPVSTHTSPSRGQQELSSDPWVQSSRSVVSGCRRRSTARCSSAHECSAAVWASKPPMSRVVLVTGVAGSFASVFARRLADLGEDAGIDKVVGIDTILPDGDLGGVKFVRADIRTPVVGKVIAVEDVDTVVHLDVNPPQRGRGRRQGAQRHRHDAAAGRLPALGPGRQARPRLVDGGLRHVAARSGDVHRVAAGPQRRRVRIPQGHRRGRVVRPRIRAAPPRRHHHDDARGPDPAPRHRHRRCATTSATRCCRRCWASTRACSSCTSTTRWRSSTEAVAARPARHVQRRRRRRRAAQPGGAPPRPPADAAAADRLRGRGPPAASGRWARTSRRTCTGC